MIGGMFDHVGIWATDRAETERLLDAVLPVLGIEKDHQGELYSEWNDFAMGADPDRPVTRRLHVGFVAPSRAAVDAFWQAGVDAGFRSDGEPGERPQYSSDYYGAFLLDPDGNSIEAVHHGRPRPDGNVDHLWIRVADIGASIDFYDRVGKHAGFQRVNDDPAFGHYRRGSVGGSFSVLPGEPTEALHMAFTSTDDAAIQGFHRELVAAGYRDNGGPGERLMYHPGYYAAFVLDPDGNNIEIVNHHRGDG
jgi:catechol 2,3-dioxygenase-like lactoylglutathione lyase family enzyme